MPLITSCLMVLGAANAMLRPVSARLRLREEEELFARGDVVPGKVGVANVVAPQRTIEGWCEYGVMPREVEAFDAARERWKVCRQGGLI